MVLTIEQVAKVEEWFIYGVKHAADYLLVIRDLIEFEDRPIYVHEWEDVKDIVRSFQREKEYRQEEVIGVYNLKKAMGNQLAASEAWFY